MALITTNIGKFILSIEKLTVVMGKTQTDDEDRLHNSDEFDLCASIIEGRS